MTPSRKLSAAVAAGLLSVVGFSAAAKADTLLSSFTPGDLVVLRGGDNTVSNTSAGEATNGYDGTVNAYLDEYTTAGSYVGTIPVPGITLDGVGVFSHEGNLNLSVNGGWLTFSGFDPNQYPAGTVAQPENGTENIKIGEISTSAASLNTSTELYGDLGQTGQFAHGALSVDGNEFYVTGKYLTSAAGGYPHTDNVGIQYVTGVGSGATVATLEGGTDWRNLFIANNTLYGGTGSSSVGNHGGYLIGSFGTLPTSGTPVHTQLTNTANSVSNLALLDIPTSDSSAGTQNGLNVMYTIADGDIGKYYYNTTTSTWTNTSFNDVDGTILANAVGLVASPDPTNSSWVDLYVSDPSGIYSYIDKSGDPTIGIAANSFTQIATPGDQGAFYGLAYSPVPEPTCVGILGLGAMGLLSRRGRKA